MLILVFFLFRIYPYNIYLLFFSKSVLTIIFIRLTDGLLTREILKRMSVWRN